MIPFYVACTSFLPPVTVRYSVRGHCVIRPHLGCLLNCTYVHILPHLPNQEPTCLSTNSLPRFLSLSPCAPSSLLSPPELGLHSPSSAGWCFAHRSNHWPQVLFSKPFAPITLRAHSRWKQEGMGRLRPGSLNEVYWRKMQKTHGDSATE